MSRARVLVIEDNDQNLYLVTYLLESHGLEVLAARDGPRGVEMAAAARPDLILLDIQLPLLDGYAVARALRAEASLASTPIVAVTSYAMVGDRERCLDAGCTDYIEKPINPEAFMLQVAAHLPPGSVKTPARG